jgi:hypothetical protein
MTHQITYDDGDAEDCFCSEQADHDDSTGDWNIFDDEDENA